jgi:23S rRNA pseudouridine2605 synthase
MVHNPHRTGAAPPGQARTSPDDDKTERVAKALARAGVASRREVERLIEAGRVALNGKVLTTPAVKVEPGDILTVDGNVVSDAEPVRVFRYHKPVGLLTSNSDPQGRPTVFENLPEGLPRLISVGRLDINSEGLLLFTNDGGLARSLELPATGLQRRYRARARGRVTQERLDKLKAGVTVEGVRYGPIEASLDKAKEGPQGANLWITVTLAEGKNREVRRVLESLGLKVNRLIRLSYGPFALGTLAVGQIEEVGPRVIREQLADYVTAEAMPKGDRPQFKTPDAAPSFRRQPGPTEVEHADLRRDGRAVRYSPPNRRQGGSHGRAEWAQAPTGEGEARKPGRPYDKRPSRGAVAEPPAKKEHKPGWAKAKPKISGHAPAKPSAGKPTSGKAFAGKPAGGKSFADKPSPGKPFAGKPFAGKPSASKPSASKPFAGKPSAGKPARGKPAEGRGPGAKAGAPPRGSVSRPAANSGAKFGARPSRSAPSGAARRPDAPRGPKRR